MLRSNTVFIVGAGASHECGLPLGTALRDTIRASLNFRFSGGSNRLLEYGDHSIFDELRRNFLDLNPYLTACHRIRDGLVLSPSIDDFINTYQHDEKVAACGKMAIARAILNAERASKLFVDPSKGADTIDFSALGNAWYIGFYQLLSQQVTHTNRASLFKNATIICFNYDRCIEHFLTHAITQEYGIDRREALDMVSQLRILRPYGSVGSYFGPNALPFGSNNLPALEHIIANLRTFTEELDDPNALTFIQSAIAEARTLVFLGNRFHENNVRLLGEAKSGFEVKPIYATTKGISDDDLVVVRHRLARVRGTRNPKIELLDFHFAQECREIFDRYWTSLRSGPA